MLNSTFTQQFGTVCFGFAEFVVQLDCWMCCFCSRATILFSSGDLIDKGAKQSWLWVLTRVTLCDVSVLMMLHNEVMGTDEMCSGAVWPCREKTEPVHLSFEPFLLSSPICLPVLKRWVTLKHTTLCIHHHKVAVSKIICWVFFSFYRLLFPLAHSICDSAVFSA